MNNIDTAKGIGRTNVQCNKCKSIHKLSDLVNLNTSGRRTDLYHFCPVCHNRVINDTAFTRAKKAEAARERRGRINRAKQEGLKLINKILG